MEIQLQCKQFRLYDGDHFPIPIEIANQSISSQQSLVLIADRVPKLEIHEIFDKQFKWHKKLLEARLKEAGLLTPKGDYTTSPDPIFWATEFTRQRYLERFHSLTPDAELERAIPYMLTMFHLSANVIGSEDVSKFGAYTDIAREQYNKHALEISRFAVNEGEYSIDEK